jgi:hypothetical protein
MKYLNTFKLFESNFSKFDIFMERIESVADDMDLYYTKNNKLKHEQIRKTLKVMNGIISSYIDDGNYSPYGDKFKINIFMKDDDYQEQKDEINTNIEFLSEIEKQEFVVYDENHTLRNIEFQKTEDFRTFTVDIEDASVVIRVISIIFDCELESTTETLFLRKQLYDTDKDFFNKMMSKERVEDIIPTFFKLYMTHKGVDLSWESLSVYKEYQFAIDIDVDDPISPRITLQDKYNDFPDFFKNVYEHSGIKPRLVSHGDSTEYYVDESTKRDGYPDGYTPNIAIQRVLDGCGIDKTPDQIFIDR